MKNIYVIFLLLFSISYGFEDFPMIPQEVGANIEYVENQNSLIKTEGMKKSSQIEEAKNNLNMQEGKKIRFDTKQIIHQRALDYMSGQNYSTVLPRF